ncbi:MAG TPA: hypothetical protein VFB06_32440 [Streptosporangiaceae bacterium]|nr:hypothetical protein [Streptosporangiaceae bacterium]
MPAPSDPWDRLRARVRQLPGLRQPLLDGCVVCRGPAGAGYARCVQCDRHAALGGRLLADTVVPVSYAVRGSALTGCLWRYKSEMRGAVAAGTTLVSLLLVFLRDHGGCVSRAGVPDRLAVVPSGYGRPGAHPLARLVAPYLRLPPAALTLRPGAQGRDLDTGRFTADAAVRGARILLLDDTWVSGASVQSASASLKLAGAASVSAVVLGRYVNAADPAVAAFAARVGNAPYDPAKCAICARNYNYSPHLGNSAEWVADRKRLL